MNKILIAAALAAFPTVASADGCNPRLQDCRVSYKDEPAIYSYSIRTARGAWPCPEEFSARECRRLRLEIASRRAREDRPRKVAGRRPVVRDTLVRPARASFGGRRCAGYVKVDGPARWLSSLAIGAARKEWRRKVRTTYGERYIDETFSPNFRISQPRIVGDRGIAVRATAQGLACAGD